MGEVVGGVNSTWGILWKKKSKQHQGRRRLPKLQRPKLPNRSRQRWKLRSRSRKNRKAKDRRSAVRIVLRVRRVKVKVKGQVMAIVVRTIAANVSGVLGAITAPIAEVIDGKVAGRAADGLSKVRPISSLKN
jgi:hypothetical protein